MCASVCFDDEGHQYILYMHQFLGSRLFCNCSKNLMPSTDCQTSPTSRLILVCDVSPVTKLTSRQWLTILNQDLNDQSFELKKQSLKTSMVMWHQRHVQHVSFISAAHCQQRTKLPSVTEPEKDTWSNICSSYTEGAQASTVPRIDPCIKVM